MHKIISRLFLFGVAAMPPTTLAAPGNEPIQLHQGQGTVKDVDPQKGTVKINTTRSAV